MAFATWWRGDKLPALPGVKEFSAGPTEDAALLAELADLEVAEVQKRMLEGHRPYVAWFDGTAVGYGWVATKTAHVGELDLTITLSGSPLGADRYLWDFATLPAWRGRGLYPRLLQAILIMESAVAERFWIIAAPENRASSAGITKAGFTSVAHLSFQRMGQPALIPTEEVAAEDERVSAAATLLQLPLLDAEPHLALSPCWHCAIDAREDDRDLAELACWPEPSSADLLVTACQCA